MDRLRILSLQIYSSIVRIERNQLERLEIAVMKLFVNIISIHSSTLSPPHQAIINIILFSIFWRK